jgi:hypothetical protein
MFNIFHPHVICMLLAIKIKINKQGMQNVLKNAKYMVKFSILCFENRNFFLKI